MANNKFNYSKYPKNPSYDDKCLLDYQFWGLHPKHGRIHVDTKRFKKMCKWLGSKEFLYDGIFKNRNTVYLQLSRIHKYDYRINIFRDLIGELKNDWNNEFKPIFYDIKSPKEVEDNCRLEGLMTTGCADDYDEIDLEAKMEGFRRINKYNKVMQSLYCQFICKVTAEIDRYILKVLMEEGYKDKDFDYKAFANFVEGRRNKKDKIKIDKIRYFEIYEELRLINNFLKHNTLDCYQKLKKKFPKRIYVDKENKIKYENGMFAGDWLIFDFNFIDNVLDGLIKFFEVFCNVYLNEPIEESKWDYDEFFINAYDEIKRPFIYLGIP